MPVLYGFENKDGGTASLVKSTKEKAYNWILTAGHCLAQTNVSVVYLELLAELLKEWQKEHKEKLRLICPEESVIKTLSLIYFCNLRLPSTNIVCSSWV